MKKHTASALASMVGRKDFFKILKGLRDHKVIYDFEPLNCINGDVHCFKVYIRPDVSFKLELFKSNFQDQINLAEQHFNKTIATVGKYVRPKSIYTFLKTDINNRLFGLNLERKFEKLVQKIIDSRTTRIMRITKTTYKDDILGTDFYILYGKKLVPIQIKAGLNRQFDHRRKFPHIPSLVCSVKLLVKQNTLSESLERICIAYQKDTILHL